MEQKKTIRITIDLPMEFPEGWNDEMIEFHLNESCYCCDNLIDELCEYSEKNGCICGITKCKVIDDPNELTFVEGDRINGIAMSDKGVHYFMKGKETLITKEMCESYGSNRK